MNIGILGGSFNPPHNGHIFIATRVQATLSLDEVWLMPCNLHPFNKTLLSPSVRFEMTKFLEEDEIKASDFEIEHNKDSYTIDTLRLLSKSYPNDTFYWILGSDQLESFQKYKEWRAIITEYPLVIFPRENPITKDYVKKSLNLKYLPNNIIILKSKHTTISSTEIRELLQRGEDISSFVPKKVKEFITKHGLYF